jgi:hypothetical protein
MVEDVTATVGMRTRAEDTTGAETAKDGDRNEQSRRAVSAP